MSLRCCQVSVTCLQSAPTRYILEGEEFSSFFPLFFWQKKGIFLDKKGSGGIIFLCCKPLP